MPSNDAAGCGVPWPHADITKVSAVTAASVETEFGGFLWITSLGLHAIGARVCKVSERAGNSGCEMSRINNERRTKLSQLHLGADV